MNSSSPQTRATPDAVPGNWVDRAPLKAQPYLRLIRADRPIGTWLLLIPCWQGLALAGAEGFADVRLIYFAILCAVGAYVMRGAGCAYNDIVDRDFDAQVERTAQRPLPAGQITVKQAWAFLIALCLVGLLILVQLNQTAVITGIASLGLVAVYPFMKRITYWPQAWLGLTFNWGALVGYAAATEILSPSAFALYAAGFFWTLGYDTIYAHQDTEDDALIGVKSTALKFGESTKRWLTGFYAATIVCFIIAGLLSNFSLFYYIGLIPGAAHFIRQISKLDIHDNHNCLTLFKSNRNAGLLLLSAPIFELVFKII